MEPLRGEQAYPLVGRKKGKHFINSASGIERCGAQHLNLSSSSPTLPPEGVRGRFPRPRPGHFNNQECKAQNFLQTSKTQYFGPTIKDYARIW